MPYISAKDDRREKLRNGEPALLAGELNYQIFYYVKHCYIGRRVEEILSIPSMTSKIKEFVKQFLGEKPNYQRYNDMTGALIRCYVEIKRRLSVDADILLEIAGSYDDEIAKYEDEKIISNGDVE
jgi:hypothetical protein